MRSIIILLMLSTAAFARDDGRYADSPYRDWFIAQQVPHGEHKGTSCCNTADGSTAQEDIREGIYYASFMAGTIPVHDMRVPPEAVLEEPNLRGVPVVWWYFDNGVIFIRCYAPGPKV